MKGRNRSALEYEADLSEGCPWLGEHPDATRAVAHVVWRVVFGDELDLLELRVCREQARADLVDQMLDRTAIEIVEDALDLVADRARPEKAGAFGHAVPQIPVTPVHVHPDREGA